MGESRLGEIHDAGEGHSDEVRVNIDLCTREITLLNCEVIEGIEDRCSTEIEIEVAPYTRSGEYFVILNGNLTGSVANLGENKTTNLGFIFKFILLCGV